MMNHRIHLLLACLGLPLLAGTALGCGNESQVEHGSTSGNAGAAGEGGAGGGAGAGGMGGSGGMGGCTTDSDCPASGQFCVVATCQTDGTCTMINAVQGLALPPDQQTAHDCKLLVCDGNGSATAQPDDTDIEGDNEICTIDSCNGGNIVHEPAAANMDCSVQGPEPAKVCGDPGGPNAGKCVECNDASGDTQCPSHVCSMNACATATCMDGVENGIETGMDCGGGECQPCGAGEGCESGADCTSTVCAGNVCQASSCMDGAKNGAETDIDCGGGTCPACGTNSVCTTNSDCAAGTCNGGVCNTTSCTTPLSFTIPGCTDLAAGKPATASGAYGGYPIAAANDGVCSSAWNAGGYSGYWQVDLGSVVPIRGVSVAVVGTPPSTVTVTISVSTDGTTFTNEHVSTVPDPGTITAYAFDFGANADARYVRFTLSSPASWVDIFEANVWQCP